MKLNIITASAALAILAALVIIGAAILVVEIALALIF